MSREIDPLDNYVLKILKLIPAEVSAAYTAINYYLKDFDGNFWLLVAFGVILMVTCYFLIKWQTQSNRQAVVTSLAFLIWAANISGSIYLTTQESAVLACVLVLSTIFLPRLYQR
jgi:FtsH-binding integral membrane protein